MNELKEAVARFVDERLIPAEKRVEEEERVPPEIVNRLNQEVVAITQTPAFNSRMESLAAFAIRATPSEFAASIAAESVKWGEVIRKAGIKLE